MLKPVWMGYDETSLVRDGPRGWLWFNSIWHRQRPAAKAMRVAHQTLTLRRLKAEQVVPSKMSANRRARTDTPYLAHVSRARGPSG